MSCSTQSPEHPLGQRRTTSFFGGAMHLPQATQIDRRLVLGSRVSGAR
ncbi:MAG: hypothetical protein KAF64_05175 [Hydrogenophaga sp.]|nr:DUF6691 family protein [Hydrogenophaga sp.]MBU7572723.1 hypothetical protein [Hydrogenophaga sp.]